MNLVSKQLPLQGIPSPLLCISRIRSSLLVNHSKSELNIGATAGEQASLTLWSAYDCCTNHGRGLGRVSATYGDCTREETGCASGYRACGAPRLSISSTLTRSWVSSSSSGLVWANASSIYDHPRPQSSPRVGFYCLAFWG